MTSLSSVSGKSVSLEQQELVSLYRSLKDKCASKECRFKADAKLQMCTACNFVNYCGVDCQKQDWPRHRKVCKFLRNPVEVPKVEVSAEEAYQQEMACVMAAPVKNPLEENTSTFVQSNELGLDETLRRLRAVGPAGNLAIGVGGFCLLNLASVRKHIQYLLIIDISKFAENFWRDMIPIIRESKSRQDCIAAISTTLIQNCSRYFSATEVHMARDYLALLDFPYSWLSNDERFQRIQGIFRANRFSFKRLDLADSDACKGIAILNQKSGRIPDLFYLSNVDRFIFPSALESFGDSLSKLTTPETLIVDTEELPFKTTRIVGEINSKSVIAALYSVCREIGWKYIPAQRVNKRADVDSSYPLIAIARLMREHSLDLTHLYYEYGLAMKYYTEEEMHDVQTRAFAEYFQHGRPTGAHALDSARLIEITQRILLKQR